MPTINNQFMFHRILHIVSSMNPVHGGVSKAVHTIASSLIKSGIDNEIVCLDSPNEEFVSNDDLKLHALGSCSNPWGYNSCLLPWLKDNLHHYGVVIVHGLWLYSSFASYLAVKNMKAQDRPKCFIMPHGMLDPYFQKAEGRRLKAIRNWLYWKLIESKVVNNTDGILFTCEEERLLAKQPFRPYRPKREYVVGLGVETPPFYQKIMDVAFQNNCKGLGNRSFLLFLSRIHEKKGVDLLMKAYEALLSDSHIELPALVIAGPGLETSYGQRIEKFVSKNERLKNCVFFPGMLSGDAKWGAFYNCEAFILPSHQENFGIAVVEALATSTPVLISNKINIWREIKNGNGGLIGEDNEEETFMTLKTWLSLSSGEKQKMNKAAREVYLNYFTVENAAKKFLEGIN